MTVKRRRGHDAIAHSGQGFDTEEEDVAERPWTSIDHIPWAEDVEQREYQIDRQPARNHRQNETRPGEADGNMVGVTKVETPYSQPPHPKSSRADWDGFWRLAMLSVRHDVRISGRNGGVTLRGMCR